MKRWSIRNSPEKWLHNWIATGPNKSKKLTRLTSPAHTTHGKVRINPLEIWVIMQRASKQRSSRCNHANSGPVVRFNGWTQLCVWCVYPLWPPCITITSTTVDWFTFSAICHSCPGTRDIVCEAMYVVFHSNFAAYIVCRRYKPCEFLGLVWTDCWGNKSDYDITSPANRLHYKNYWSC